LEKKKSQYIAEIDEFLSLKAYFDAEIPPLIVFSNLLFDYSILDHFFEDYKLNSLIEVFEKYFKSVYNKRRKELEKKNSQKIAESLDKTSLIIGFVSLFSDYAVLDYFFEYYDLKCLIEDFEIHFKIIYQIRYFEKNIEGIEIES